MRFLPTGNPPHRERTLADAALRVAMVRAAVADQPAFVVDDREVRRAGASYTVDTLTELREEFPQRSLCLLLGMDAFLGLPNWHRWRELFDLAHVVVAHRPGWKAPTQGPLGELMVDRGTGAVNDLHKSQAGRIYVHAVTQLEISSTELRQIIDAGRDPRFLVPDAGARDHPRVRVLCSTPLTNSRSEMATKTASRRAAAPPKTSIPQTLLRIVKAALDDMKAVNVKVMDVRHLTDITDIVVIASGNSDRHVKSIADRVVQFAKQNDFRPIGVEGAREGEWVLVDLNDVVVHVMLPRVREFYGLEKLWEDVAPPAAGDRGRATSRRPSAREEAARRRRAARPSARARAAR